MKQTEFKKLTALLDQKKFEEAKKLIQDHYSQELTESETGQAYTMIALAYMKAMNQINRRYLDSINQTIKELNELKKVKATLNKHLGIIEAKSEIEEA